MAPPCSFRKPTKDGEAEVCTEPSVKAANNGLPMPIMPELACKDCELRESHKGEEKRIITLMTKFSPVPYAKLLFTITQFIYDKRKQFWRYDSTEGLWKVDAEQFIKTELRKTLMGEEQQKKYYTDEVVSYIKDISYKGDFEFKKNPYLIAFKDSLFDLERDCFVEYSPECYITNKLDIKINGEKICSNIDKFFADCLDEEHKVILYDVAAYTLFTGYPYQKLFFIFGPPDTGKSQYLKLLEEFLGKSNHCMVEPRTIQADKHAIYKMWLKLANIVSDMDYNAFDNVNQIKKLTGGDSVSIRPMYQEGFDETLYAKQIYSTNKLPAVKEKTMAWYRRMYLINFVNIVNPSQKDLFIIGKLTTKQELEGFAYQCLQQLRELHKNKFIFTYDMDETKMPALYEKLSNPVLLFIEENCTERRTEWCFKYEFEERLNNWLTIHHLSPMTKSEINQYMKERYTESNRPAPEWTSGSFEGKTYRVWVGLRWKLTEDKDNLTNLTDLHTFTKEYYIYRRSFKTPVNP